MESEAEGTEYSSEGEKKEYETEANCPTCGYHVGGRPTCPRCGARVEKSLALSLMRKISVVGSLVGIVLLWAATYYKKPPTIEISQISETMNNALVRIEGRVSGLNIDEEEKSFSITLSQGPDEIRLRGFGNLDEFKEELEWFPPNKFDRIAVTSSLMIDAKFGASMFLSIPQRLELLEEFEREKKSMLDLTEEDVGEYYVVEGTVGAINDFSAGRKITLVHKGVRYPLTVFNSQFKRFPERVKNILTDKGTRIEVFVEVSEFRDEMQFNLASPGNPNTIKRVNAQQSSGSDQAYSRLETGEVSLDKKNRVYKLNAKITGIQKLSNGVILTVDDNSGASQLFVWEGNYQKLPGGRDALATGRWLQGRVKVSEYDNQPQLRISDFNSVQFK